MGKEKRKDDLKAAFEAAHYRKPTPEEGARIDRAVDGYVGQVGRPPKGRDEKDKR